MHIVRFRHPYYEIGYNYGEHGYQEFEVLEKFMEEKKEQAYALCSYLNGGKRPRTSGWDIDVDERHEMEIELLKQDVEKLRKKAL